MDQFAATNRQGYEYQSLQTERSFRVLLLQPARSPDEPIQFNLEEAGLDNAPQYLAISYTWDDQLPDQDAFCHGRLLRITPNCSDILTMLRHADRPRAVWIDQICIDQASDRDRSENVRRMADIYSKATNTVVWLGSLDPELLDFLRRYSRASGNLSLAEFDAHIHDDRPFPLPALQKLPLDEDLSTFDDDTRFITAFAQMRWFQRMWTLQEALMSNSRDMCILSGDYLISIWHVIDRILRVYASQVNFSAEVEIRKLTEFYTSCLVFASMRQIYRNDQSTENDLPEPVELDGQVSAVESTGIESLGAVLPKKTFRGAVSQFHLSSLLARTESRKCTDPRDKVFSLYSILTSWWKFVSGRPDIDLPVPDYRKSTGQVLAEAVAWSLLPGPWQDSVILYTPCLSKSQLRTTEAALVVPSWVPDVSRICQLTPRPDYTEDLRDLPYSASGTSKISSTFLAELDVLQLPGDIIDTVCCAAEVNSGRKHWSYLVQRHLQHTGIDRNSALMDLERQLRQVVSRGAAMAEPEPVQMVEDSEDAEYAFIYQIMQQFSQRSYAVGIRACESIILTKHGRIGLGTGDFQDGDDVAVASGFQRLLTLRPLIDFGSAADGTASPLEGMRLYRLIGHAYIADIMNGEAWPDNPADLSTISLV